MKITVDIEETYPGSMHYYVTLDLPGFGCDENKESRGRAFIVREEDLVEKTGLTVQELYEDGVIETFRPEYAKAIKQGLESVEFN